MARLSNCLIARNERMALYCSLMIQTVVARLRNCHPRGNRSARCTCRLVLFADFVWRCFRLSHVDVERPSVGNETLDVDTIGVPMVYLDKATFGRAMPKGQMILDPEFTRFVKEVESRLSYAFFAAYGPEVGSEVTAESLVYAWEHWSRVRTMSNPVGYLYRVGQSKARWYHRPRTFFPRSVSPTIPEVEPKLPEALKRLTENQRLAVVLVHGMEWTEEEVASLIGCSRSTVHTHLERGLAHLRNELEVVIDA